MQQPDEEAMLNQLKDGFVNMFYGAMKNGPQIADMYLPTAVFTSEGNKTVGSLQIAEKHTTMFASMDFAVTTSDCQKVSDTTILISVLGQLKDAAADKALGFNHTFTLQNVGNGMLISNEIFRISVHNF